MGSCCAAATTKVSGSASAVRRVRALPITARLAPRPDTLLIIRIVDVEQADPGEAHFIDGPLTVANPVAGIRVVGTTSLWLFFLLSAPFALVVVLAPFKMGTMTDTHAAPAATGLGLIGGVLVAMWNNMGWDNASTIAQEVERPQRTYPRAMIAAVALVALTYVLPFAAVYLTGAPSSLFGEDGSWATVAGAR